MPDLASSELAMIPVAIAGFRYHFMVHDQRTTNANPGLHDQDLCRYREPTHAASMQVLDLLFRLHTHDNSPGIHALCCGTVTIGHQHHLDHHGHGT